MARRAKRSNFNGARRRKAKRQATANERWLHLGAGGVSARGTLQTAWQWTALAGSVAALLTTISMVVHGLVADEGDEATASSLWDAVKGLTVVCAGYVEICDFTTSSTRTTRRWGTSTA